MLLSTHYKQVIATLNRSVSRTAGPLASFDIAFWGANPMHMLNSNHRHSAFWIGYVLTGQGSYIEEKASFPLAPGTLFCSRPGVWRQIRSGGGLSLLWVSFRLKEAASSEAALTPFRRLETTTDFVRPHAETTPTAKLWEALWLQAEQLPQAYASVLESTAYALLMSLPSLFGELRPAYVGENAGRSEHASLLLRQAKWFMADNLSLQLRLEEVARHLHVSGRHLSRLFREEDGLSYSSYLRKLRMDKTRREVAETDWPLSQIARDNGFGNIHYLTRVFKAETGQPPGDYRRRHRTSSPGPTI